MSANAAWGAGPWDNEPDELDGNFGDIAWRIVRGPFRGQLNGYIAVPRSHPWYGRDLAHLPHDFGVGENHREISFSDQFHTHTYATASDDRWWVGFHCGSTWDYSPGIHGPGYTDRIRLGDLEPTVADYWTIGRVRAALEQLARLAIKCDARRLLS